MLSKRHADILRILDVQGTVTVAALARALDVSQETMRRDLRPLTDGGAVLRMHGAVSLAGPAGEAPFRRRMRENAAAKQAIARAFAVTVQTGDVLMLDTGTTTSFVARALTGHKRLTVITNSTDVARTLSVTGDNRVYLAGGALRADSGAVLGRAAVEFVAGYHARIAVISAGAVDAAGVMDFDPDEADFARALLGQAERRVIVTDATKFGRRGLVTVAGFDLIDEMICDTAPPAVIGQALAEANVALKAVATTHWPAEPELTQIPLDTPQSLA